MKTILNILFVEDVQTEAELIWLEIERNNILFDKKLVATQEEYIESLEIFRPDIIVSDYSLPQFNGMAALRLRNEKLPMVPFILVTGSHNEEVAVECMKAGADDYILKGNLSRLGSAIVNAVNKIKLLRKITNTENRLHESHSLNETLIKTIPFGMNIVSSDGTIRFQNDVFRRLFGDSAIGNKCWEMMRDDRMQCAECPLKRGINIDKTDVQEVEGVLGNRICELSYTGMMYRGENALLEIFLDITDRKLVEAELLKSKEKAEESDRLKTAFLNNISHEIRTPMNAIVGFSALLNEPDTDPLARQSYIDIIVQSSNHLLEIINDIVDIANIDARLVKALEKECNLKATLKMIYDQFLPVATERGIRLLVEYGLSDQDMLIKTDATKLTQVLSNLVSNSLKFTNDGYVKIKVRPTGEELEFSVADTGIGIDRIHHARIFDRFYQVHDSISRIYEGTGLGLSISKANVELLGGKIWLESDPGSGTTFFFSIPHRKQIQVLPPKRESALPDDHVFKSRKRVLVAEDIESNFKLIKYFLSRSNVEIVKAVNGKEAVEKCIEDKGIDMVLMDIKMPVMDGFTATRLIRKARINVPIIAQTAYSDDRDSALAVGCNGFITKPFDKKSLLKIMTDYI